MTEHPPVRRDPAPPDDADPDDADQDDLDDLDDADGADDADDGEVLDLDDADLLEQADWIVGGEEAQKARKQGLYVAYVLLLLSAFYGFPFVQAVFKTTDQAVLRDQLTSVPALVVAAGAAVALFGAALWAGRFRGPVVPPLPWIDLVVTAPIDRALAVRRWWRYALAGGLFLGTLSGLVLGSGLAFAAVTSSVAILVTTVGGALVGGVVTHLWLFAQVRSWPSPNHRLALLWRVPDALRELHVESLRTHSANTSTLAGSALTGNLRTARLALARPVRVARGARLRAGRPFPTMVRRDVLGLRRAPASFAAGLGLLALGTAVVVWSLSQPAAPGVAATIALVPLYLGFGTWVEGLRLQADNIGTPSLLGCGPRTEAAAHLVVPAALTTVALAAGAAVAALSVPVTRATVAALAVVVVLLCGGHLLAAFRGTPPVRVQSRPQAMISWYLMPVTFVIALGSLTAFVAKAELDIGLAIAAALALGLLAWGFRDARHLTHLHRT